MSRSRTGTPPPPGIRLFDQVLAAPKRFVAGTHRARAPSETLARARALMPQLGITRLANLTGLDNLGVPVFAAIRPNGRSLSTSQGKGLDADAAAASALMESIETWHAENLRLPVERGSPRAMHERLPVVDVRKLPIAPGAVIDPRVPIDWVEGWDLLQDTAVWVPEASVTLDCVMPRDHLPTFDVSSNGLASGNHLLEAISHGLCEVIERDAEARWRERRGQKRVELATVVDAACRGIIEKVRAAGVHVTVWDITSDVGVPAYGAAFMEDPREPAWRSLGLYQGFGCHLSPAIALMRALTEAAQTRLTYIAGSRDDFFPHDYERATDEELLLEIWEDLSSPAPGVVTWVDHGKTRAHDGPTFEADVGTLLARLRGVGVRSVIAVDLTHEALGVPVVKVLVPGRATRVDMMG